MDSLVNMVEKAVHDTRIVEAEAESLTSHLTLGEDKRLAATARTHMQTARLYLQELRATIASRDKI